MKETMQSSGATYLLSRYNTLTHIIITQCCGVVMSLHCVDKQSLVRKGLHCRSDAQALCKKGLKKLNAGKTLTCRYIFGFAQNCEKQSLSGWQKKREGVRVGENKKRMRWESAWIEAAGYWALAKTQACMSISLCGLERVTECFCMRWTVSAPSFSPLYPHPFSPFSLHTFILGFVFH